MSGGSSSVARAPNTPPLLDLYRGLLLIRKVEERLIGLFAEGEVPGFIHLGIGQEAISVGVMAHLGPADTIASTHRGHGHALAKGLSLDGFFAELMGKADGLCKGRGGSMHVADTSIGMLGANGIVGAGLSIALGSALAHRTLGREAVAAAFFGDAAMAEGLLHESLNIAALWSLPILFVCENNGWGEFLATSKQVAFRLEDLAGTFGLAYRRVDGNDVAQVSEAAEQQVARIRGEGRPAVLECVTTRVRGHFEGDPQKYRAAAELAEFAERDPLRITAAQLEALGVEPAALSALAEETDAAVEQSVAAARAAAQPSWADALRDVYTTGAA